MNQDYGLFIRNLLLNNQSYFKNFDFNNIDDLTIFLNSFKIYPYFFENDNDFIKIFKIKYDNFDINDQNLYLHFKNNYIAQYFLYKMSKNIDYLKESAKNGYIPAIYRLGKYYYNIGNFEEGINLLSIAANNDNYYALTFLGKINNDKQLLISAMKMENKYILNEDDEKASLILAEIYANENNYESALLAKDNEIGKLIFKDIPNKFKIKFLSYLNKDYQKAFREIKEYLEKDEGCDEFKQICNRYLGNILYHGLGCEKDDKMAKKHLKKDKHYESKYLLGLIYFNDEKYEKSEKYLREVPLKYEKTQEYLTKIADDYLKYDFDEALKLYEYAESNDRLAYIYLNGYNGSEQNYSKALEYAKKSDNLYIDEEICKYIIKEIGDNFGYDELLNCLNEILKQYSSYCLKEEYNGFIKNRYDIEDCISSNNFIIFNSKIYCRDYSDKLYKHIIKLNKYENKLHNIIIECNDCHKQEDFYYLFEIDNKNTGIVIDDKNYIAIVEKYDGKSIFFCHLNEKFYLKNGHELENVDEDNIIYFDKIDNKYYCLQNGKEIENLCAICLDELFKFIKDIKMTECKHFFHKNCLNNIKECPLCRGDIS